VSRLRLAAVTLVVMGGAQLLAGCYIPAKARAAQALLELAWGRERATGAVARPWPWATHWPVARLRARRLHVDEIVLAGARGASLAFGPGHVDGTPLPGEAGNVVVAGHRDTSFAFLQRLRRGDRLEVETPFGRPFRYEVTGTRVLRVGDRDIAAPTSEPTLTLLTCYPFDAVWPGTPLRYVVRARLVTG